MDEIVFNNSMTKTKNSLFLLHMFPTSFLNDSNMVHILRDHKSFNIDFDEIRRYKSYAASWTTVINTGPTSSNSFWY